MKSLMIVAVAALFAVPATDSFAGGHCRTTVKTVRVIQKCEYVPVIAVADNCTPAPSFSRRPHSPSRRGGADLTVGSTVTAPGRFLGDETGAVFLRVGPTCLECEVLEWCSTGVTFVVPNMGLGPAAPASLEIVRADGRIASNYGVCLVRKPDLIVHEPTPAQSPATLSQTIGIIPQG